MLINVNKCEEISYLCSESIFTTFSLIKFQVLGSKCMESTHRENYTDTWHKWHIHLDLLSFVNLLIHIYWDIDLYWDLYWDILCTLHKCWVDVNFWFLECWTNYFSFVLIIYSWKWYTLNIFSLVTKLFVCFSVKLLIFLKKSKSKLQLIIVM